jgi:CRP/FNR family cyclic AMP-dependent transcriptional regulator
MNISHTVSITALRTLPIFSTLDAERLVSIARQATLHHVDRRTPIVRAGNAFTSVFLILAGRVKVQLSNANGREVILAILEQGELFGELEAIDEQPSAATITTVDPCDLVVILSDDFRRCMAVNPDISRYIMCRMVKRLRLADSKIGSLAQQDVHGRVASLLYDLAESQHGYRVVARHISRTDIARMVGASREMVSRVMRDLQLRGLISESEGLIRLHADNMADTA